MVRETRFVEIGPVVAFHHVTFEALLPFPPLRFGWGLDQHWSALALQYGWRIGVVDATPIRHGLRRIAASYGHDEAIAEARRFLDGRPYTAAADAQRTAGHAPVLVVRVLVVAEYYPRAADPVGGVWAHRQALAARKRPAPRSACSSCTARSRRCRRSARPRSVEGAAVVAQPSRAQLDGIEVRVRPLSVAAPAAELPLLGSLGSAAG